MRGGSSAVRSTKTPPSLAGEGGAHGEAVGGWGLARSVPEPGGERQVLGPAGGDVDGDDGPAAVASRQQRGAAGAARRGAVMGEECRAGGQRCNVQNVASEIGHQELRPVLIVAGE